MSPMPEATRLIVMRHGETAWNVDGRIQGQLDVGLNDKGRWQAQRLGQALSGETIDAVVSSDLWRAYDTALAVATPHQQTVLTDVGLRERGFGEFEGKTFTELNETHPAEAARWRQRDPQFAPPGGENLLQFRERILQCLRGLCRQFFGQQVAIVTHGGALDVIYRAATGLDLQAPRTWMLGNASINRVLWVPQSIQAADDAGQFTLVGWADDFHLAEDSALDERVT